MRIVFAGDLFGWLHAGVLVQLSCEGVGMLIRSLIGNDGINGVTEVL
jgi:hypothetical protein